MEARVSRMKAYIITGVLSGCVMAFGIWLILTARNSSRAKAHQLNSINNLKNLALAVHDCAVMNGGGLPNSHWEHDPPLSWRTQILQFLDRADKHRAYRPEFAFDAEENALVTNEWIRVFDAPAGDFQSQNSSAMWRSDYDMVSGPGTVQPDDRSVTFDEISEGDGLSRTLLIVECSGLQLGWAEPRDPRVDRETIGIEKLSKIGQSSKYLISTYNDRGAPVAFADCSARVISNKIDPKVLAALCTINGGEKITPEDYQQ